MPTSGLVHQTVAVFIPLQREIKGLSDITRHNAVETYATIFKNNLTVIYKFIKLSQCRDTPLTTQRLIGRIIRIVITTE